MNPEALEEWRGNPITRQVMELVKEEKQRLLESMGNGHFLNLENMEESFGNAAKCVGVVEGVGMFFSLLDREENNG
jgi:hypothetical protein